MNTHIHTHAQTENLRLRFVNVLYVLVKEYA